MEYNFDEIIERRGSGALKTDALLERFGRDDLTALWVADMDFATPPFIVDALRRRLEHPIFGYTIEPSDYRPAIIDWLRSLHGVEVRPVWISFIPGIVKGIGLAINCFLKEDEKVVIMPPVYHPFRIVPEMNGREVVWWPLKEGHKRPLPVSNGLEEETVASDDSSAASDDSSVASDDFSVASDDSSVASDDSSVASEDSSAASDDSSVASSRARYIAPLHSDYPSHESLIPNHQSLIPNHQSLITTTYSIDFDRMEEVFDEKCKMLILSNPHNPAGIVWSREDLEKIADFCHKRGILVISDEIHSEMILPRALKDGKKHIPFYDVSEAARRCSITFAAPSKTFNIAGIVSSYAIVPDERLRERYFTYLKANELDEPTLFAPIATIAAYREGEEWRRQMLDYVEGNIDMVEEYCREYFGDKIRVWRPDASFLVWLDCRGLGLSQDKLVELFRDKAKLALNDGAMFGPGGEGFMRLNVGAPRSLLREALEKLLIFN